jgi:hypothetical protein
MPSPSKSLALLTRSFIGLSFVLRLTLAQVISALLHLVGSPIMPMIKFFVYANLDKSSTMTTKEPSVKRQMPTIDPKDLIGRTFLKDAESNGQRFRAQIVQVILDQEVELQRNPEHIKFLCEVDGDTADDIYTYNQVMDFIERDNFDLEINTEQLYQFCCITAHQGPLCASD